MDSALLAILVCPVCRGALHYDRQGQALVCLAEGLAYPIRDQIPVMLREEATELTLDEVEALKQL